AGRFQVASGSCQGTGAGANFERGRYRDLSCRGGTAASRIKAAAQSILRPAYLGRVEPTTMPACGAALELRGAGTGLIANRATDRPDYEKLTNLVRENRRDQLSSRGRL